MTLILATEAMRVVQKNERGVVTKRVRYTKGDEVDANLLEEGRVETLKRLGSLVESEEDSEEDSNPFSTERVGDLGTNDMNPNTPTGEGDADGDDSSEADIENADAAGGDRYDGMDYAALRTEAHSRDGVSASGSADDLRARLREDDADNE